MEMNRVMKIASQAIQSHKKLMEIVAENIANAKNSPSAPNEEPYRRQRVEFKSVYQEAVDAMVPSLQVSPDQSQFKVEYKPGHPAADETGHVQMPNVSVIRELADLRKGQQHVYANLRVWEGAQAMEKEIIQILSKN